ERSAGTKHLERSQVQFFISAESGIEILLAFGKRGRIENNCVVLFSRGSIVAQQIESIGFNPLDLPAVQSSILICNLTCRRGTIHAGHARTMRRKMKRKSSLIAADIQSLSSSILRRGCIVFPLI